MGDVPEDNSWTSDWHIKCAKYIAWHKDEGLVKRANFNTRSCFYDPLANMLTIAYGREYADQLDEKMEAYISKLYCEHMQCEQKVAALAE
eukprot:6099515-Karenia_brevis.AAC.1